MDKKPRRISMTDEGHFELKLMATAAGIPAGDLIGFMVKSLAQRLQDMRKEARLPSHCSFLVSTLIHILLLRDAGIMSKEEYDRELKEIASHKDDTEFYGVEELMRRVKQEVEDESG